MRKALFLLLLASCGDNAVPKMPLAEFLTARHDAECARLTRCGLFSSEHACNAYFRWPDEAALVNAVANDKIGYDGAAAFDCLEAIATVSCDKTQRDARETPTACANVFRGRVKDGAQCAFDDECRSGACENIPACTRDVCCFGTCGPSGRAIDQSCTRDSQCADGAYCHKSNVCRPRVGENMSCDDARGCDFGLACVGVTDLDPGTCRKLPAIGESCPYKLCASINASCVNFTCVPLGIAAAPCTADTECSYYGECDEPAGACRETPTLGMPCEVYCGGESWCDETKVCAAPLPAGALCGADNQCASTDCFEGEVFDLCQATAVCI